MSEFDENTGWNPEPEKKIEESAVKTEADLEQEPVLDTSREASAYGTTYSWVNPKLTRNSQEGDPADKNPWSSGDGTNYWEYGHEEKRADAQAPASDPEPVPERKSRGAMRQDAFGKPEKPLTRGSKWTLLVTMALVFGLIAGLTTYGVNLAANKLHPVTGTVASASEEAEDNDTKAEREEIATVPEIEQTGETAASEAAEESDVATEEMTNIPGDTSVVNVATTVMPAMVTITTMSVQEMKSFFGGTQEYPVQGAGTGVIIGQNETELLIATNNHVIEGATQVSVGFIDESAISAQIKGADPDHDLAIVSVKLENIPEATQEQIKVVKIGDSDQLKLGQQVVAIGNALGYGQSVTSGYVSALNRTLTFQDGSSVFVSDGLIQTDAAINSGNSGGALLNMSGELIGINEAKSSMSSSGATVDNVGYAIPMAKAQPILEQLMNEETREILDAEDQGYLGVNLVDVTADYAQYYDMPQGVCFSAILENGPADEAGAEVGDVLTKIAGKKVTSYQKLESILQYYRAGETVDMTVMRKVNGEYKEVKLTITLGSREVLEKLQAMNEAEQEQKAQPTEEPKSNIFEQIFGGE